MGQDLLIGAANQGDAFRPGRFKLGLFNGSRLSAIMQLVAIGMRIAPTVSQKSTLSRLLRCTLHFRVGSLADKLSQAKIQLCPLLSASGQTRAQLDCPLYARSGLSD